MAAAMKNRNDYQRVVVTNSSQHSNSHNNNRKEKIIIQNQMILNVPQQQQRVTASNNQPPALTQPASIFATTPISTEISSNPIGNNNNNTNINSNNNHEMSHIIAASPTAATYFQAQLANNTNHSQPGITHDHAPVATDTFPVVTYNGSNYVITRGSGAADYQLNEKQDVMVHFRGHLYAGSEVKPTNIIVMSPIQACDPMTATMENRKAITTKAICN